MSYLEEFQNQINYRDFNKFFQLWEEYVTNDEVDVTEFKKILTVIRDSDFAGRMGEIIETALPFWEKITDEEDKYQVLKLIIDIQTTNTPGLAKLTYDALEARYSNDPEFKEWIRIVGLRTLDNFQGAISNYDLLHHLKKGQFVFHISGWGTGEVMEVSPLLERASIEFENVPGVKHITFDKGFHCLVPLEQEHFLARRFGDPDRLEMEAKDDPVKVIKMLLKDLGPKTATEIKDEMSELVIPEKEWVRWWQNTRAKLKKNTLIENPSSQKKPFILREKEVSHIEQLQQALSKKLSLSEILLKTHSFARDFPDQFRKAAVKDPLKETLIELLNKGHLTLEEQVQLLLCLDIHFGHQDDDNGIIELIKSNSKIDTIIESIDILAFKKRALTLIKENREDWVSLFLTMLFTSTHGQIKDTLLADLVQEEARQELIEKLDDLLNNPMMSPETFVWYFQKIAKNDDLTLPFADKDGQCQFLETFLVLLHKIEHEADYKELTKKMYNLLTAKRFMITRNLIEGSSLDFINEFLLLASKIQIFDDNEKKILRSLAEVVHPSLAPKKQDDAVHVDPSILWTTEEGYIKTQERIKEIATVEMIQNAKEVEAARELGDLRENSEYKFACERRSRLQGEMKTLSKQLNKARVITKHDILHDQISIGNIVDLETPTGDVFTYTILGPWDTDVEKNVISYQSQLAEAMRGKKVNETFTHKDESFKVTGIKSFL